MASLHIFFVMIGPSSQMVIECHFVRGAKILWRVCTFHRLTLAFATVQNLMCCLKWRFVCYSRQQRVLW